jgi:ABC-2 family transporter protein
MKWIHEWLTLLRLDAKLVVRHKLVHVMLAVAIGFGSLIAFAFPEQLDMDGMGAMDGMGDIDQAMPAPTILEPGAVKPPFDDLMLLVMYALDLCLLGFMFGSVMILQDKEQGTIRYFRIAPGSALQYMTSKLTLNVGLSLVNLVVLTAFVAPWALAKPELYALTLLICAGMTTLGMTIACFMRNISQWFFPAIALSLIGTLPVSLVFTPTQSLAWTRWLPTYHILFGSEAVLFGDAEVATTSLVYALVFAALTAAACGLAIRSRLLREVH